MYSSVWNYSCGCKLDVPMQNFSLNIAFQVLISLLYSLIYCRPDSMSKKILWFLSLSILFFACENGNVDLDNGGDQPLNVTIDGMLYQLSPGGYENVALEQGLHNIVIRDANNKVLKESRFTVIHGGLLNISETDYYIWTDLYGDPGLRESKLKEDWVQIGKKKFFGDFIQLPNDELYIEKRWDYGLSDDFPSDLLGWEPTSEKYIIRSKLYRVDKLTEAYEALVEEAPPTP